MTFLSPWAVWALAGIPLVVALYFLRLKRRAVKVSTHMFWERAANQTSRNAFFQRLRHLLSLLLHIIIVLLLAGALAKPVVDRFIHDGASVVFILDSRARMQAVGPDGVTRYEKALNSAKAYIRDADDQRQFALITLDSAATVTVPFSGEEKPLSDALATARVSDATGDIDSAVALANSLLEARKGDRRIILLSDRAPQSASAFPLVAHAFPAIAGNLAITRFATRPLPANPETSEVLLEVRNFGNAAAKATVELTYDGRPLDAKALTLAPNSASMTVFPALIKAGRASRGWLEAKIDVADALPLDNRAFATIPPPRAKRVLLISNGSFFLEKIMESDSSVKFEMLTPDAYSPEIASKFSAVIFDGVLPAGFDLAKSDGNFLFLKTTPFPAGIVLDQPLVTDLDSSHPTTRNVNLRNVSILRAQSLALPPSENGWKYAAPLRSFDNALLIAGQRGQQRVAALAFDVADSDLPLRVAFPLLISNTVHWLAGEEPDVLPGVAAGKTFPLETSQKASAAALTVWPKDGIITPPELTGAFRPMKSGFYQVSDSSSTRWLSVNTFSADESNIYANNSDSAAAPLPGTVFSGWPIWQWLAIAAFSLSICEWWLHHRRRTE